MLHTIIFDLSEVLIAGLLGVEKVLSPLLNVPEDTILPALGGAPMEELFRGRVSEETYLENILKKQGWETSIDTLKTVFRKNFEHRVPGMEEVLAELAAVYELILLSDHAVEWIDHIRASHPFLETFNHQMFSFETGYLKKEPVAFHTVLQSINRRPEECLFVDDNPLNVNAAADTGIAGIVFTDADQLASDLGSYKIMV
jgi:FMN phosphatase YigB (HAD superfamily)